MLIIREAQFKVFQELKDEQFIDQTVAFLREAVAAGTAEMSEAALKDFIRTEMEVVRRQGEHSAFAISRHLVQKMVEMSGASEPGANHWTNRQPVEKKRVERPADEFGDEDW